ncbi:hypothetical protein BKA61DRAFT_677513 [Leptodontidium sp. MPI-SDFR-AT-0119]|nr:hypothetical protein BKA61DRAFT_677513 [Leptodontidium sp. MPI-SDFR-AT-0119]
MSTFTLFPLLAGELQLRIWELSIQDTPALLPRRPIAGLATCRASRSVYLKVYTRFFKSTAQSLFEYPISLYANRALDSTLYLDSESILLKNFDDWIEPGFKDTIKHLAIEDVFWKQPQPRPELLVNDLRFKIFHPNTGIEAVGSVSLVLTSSAYPDTDDSPTQPQTQTREIGREKLDLDLNYRKLELCDVAYPEDSLVREDVRAVFGTLDGLHQAGYLEGWVEPELRMTRIVYE